MGSITVSGSALASIKRMGEADKARIAELEICLARCLEEAKHWIFEATGKEAKDIIDYDGWEDRARSALMVTTDSRIIIKSENLA